MFLSRSSLSLSLNKAAGMLVSVERAARNTVVFVNQELLEIEVFVGSKIGKSLVQCISAR